MLLLSLPAFSQGNAGRILGAVIDSNGGVIAGATVTVLDVQRGTARTLTADDSGSYNAPNLLPGSYKVRAEFAGFRIIERQNIVLEVGQEIRVDLTLQPGQQTETITVTESLPLVNTTNAELGGTLSNETINDLPLNGRNFANLLQLRPGVTMYPGGSGWTQSTNGMRAKDNVYMVDGVNSSDPWMGQSVMNAVMAGGDAGTILSIDAIDEFKTEQNPRAEYGWKPGSIVNVGVKSGTNTYHGTGYAFGRNGNWDARNWFQTAGAPGGAPTTKFPVELEQFGATFGGPIKKDKLFFFAAFENQQYTIGATGLLSDPITGAGVGDATTNLLLACQATLDVGAPGSGTAGALTALSAQIAGITVGPVAAGHPNGTCTGGSNYPGLFPVNSGAGGIQFGSTLFTQNKVYSGLGKIDYHISDKHSLNAMYFISPGSGLFNDGPNTQTNPQWETNQYARSMVYTSTWTYTPNSAWVNEARVGYSHYYQTFFSADHNQNPANYTFNGSNYQIYTGQANPFYFGLPSISVSGFNGVLGTSWPKVVGPDGVVQVVDHISYLHGHHTFKFGGEILSSQSTSNVTANTKGPIAFSNLQDFFNGFPNGPTTADSAGTATILTGNLLRHFSVAGYALFLQDDWRIKPRLVLNLGLRYEIDTVPKERNNLQGNFNPATPTGVVQVGNGITNPYNGDHNNFGPRIGLAWDIFGNSKTVFRAGGGILYEQLSLDVFNGIGNSFGLRTAPSGATLASCSVQAATFASCTAAGGTPVIQPGFGTINVLNVAFAGTPIINNNTPGTIPYQWANNGAATPIYSLFANPACGDGKTTYLGYVPSQCNVAMVDPNLRTPYVANWSVGIQRAITNNLSIDLNYVGNHGTKLIGALDINQPASVTHSNLGAGIGTVTTGAGWTDTQLVNCATAPSAGNCAVNAGLEQAARPFYSKFPYLKFIDEYGNLDSSNYHALQAVLSARNYHGLSLTTGYTYSHALGYSSDQGTSGGLVIPINSYGNLHSQLYSSTTFDVRQRLTVSSTFAIPSKKSPGQILQGWLINSVVLVQSGTPWGVADTTTDFAGTGEQAGNSQANQASQWTFIGNASDFTPNHNYAGVTPAVANGAPGVPWFAGTTNQTCLTDATAIGPLAVGSLTRLGCYALGKSVLIPAPYGGYGAGTRNLFTGQGFRNVDFSVSKSQKFGERLTAQFRAECFNVLNHVTFTNPSGGPGGNSANLNPARAGSTKQGLGFAVNTPDQAGSNPVLGSGGARHIQLGLKLIF
jgi:hypothetical protein